LWQNDDIAHTETANSRSTVDVMVISSSARTQPLRAEAPEAFPSKEPPAGSRRSLPVFAAVGCVLAFLFTYGVFVVTAGGQRAEDTILRNAQSASRLGQDSSATLLQGTDVATVILLAAGLVVLIAAIRRRYVLGLVSLVALGVSLLATDVLKTSVLARPDLGNEGRAWHNSFPSGHASAAMACVLAVALVVPRRGRPFVVVPGAIAVAWVSSSTITLAWHRLSDTVGGTLLVTAIFALAAAGLAWRSSGRLPTPSWGTVALALLVPTIISFAGFVVLTELTALDTAVALASLSAVAVSGFALWFLRGVDVGGPRHAA
jgi:membrane-associated phospholipid phosphatase